MSEPGGAGSGLAVAPAAGHEAPSAWRAWWYLVWISWLRQMPLPGLRGLSRPAHIRQMVWISLGLLVVAAVFTAFNTGLDRWSMANWRRSGMTYKQWSDNTQIAVSLYPRPAQSFAPDLAILASTRAILEQSDFLVFVYGMLMGLFLAFFMPIWTLSFATDSVGGERESQSLIWLLTRPMSRWSIYLAKFLAVLPWCLFFNVGGFVLICLLGGEPGRRALPLFWPVVVWTTIAFTALFSLMGALFRRPAVIAAVYVFFLEILFGSMPGYLKRVSITFYARCMMFDAGEGHGLVLGQPHIYLPVDGTTAWLVLMLGSVLFLGAGMYLFGRKEYHAEG